MCVCVERGVAGSDPRTRGRSLVVLEVLFHSRAIPTRGIQSEIVIGYFITLVFALFEAGWYTCRNTRFFLTDFSFLLRRSKVTRT